MSEVFGPEKVRKIVLNGDSDMLWSIDNEPFPLPLALVLASDYDQLLALYRESISLDMKFWPCKEGNHGGCACEKEIRCSCECHRKDAQSAVK